MKWLLIAAFPLIAVGPDMASLGWMSGCWVMERNGTRIEEHWSKPVGEIMLGYGRTIRPGRPVSFEQLRIEVKEGQIQYIPIVGKQGPIPFTLKSSGDQQVIFENPSHDYPQRISYTRAGDELRARTELLNESNPRPQNFAYKRITCD